MTMAILKLLAVYMLVFNSMLMCMAKPKAYSVYGNIERTRLSPPKPDLFHRFNEILNREQDRAILERSLENFLQNEALQRSQGVFPYDPKYPLDGQQPLTLDYVEANNDNDYAPEESVAAPGEETHYLDRADNGMWLDGQVIPQITPLEQSDADGKDIDNILLNYLYDQYVKVYGSDADLPINNPFDNKHIDDGELNFEKRRQKIIIKDDKRQDAKVASTTSTSTTTTTTTMKPVIKKIFMKPSIRGQKEIPLLRPAEVKPKEQWPTELEMAEGEEEGGSPMNRHVRDVFAEQLDMLKKEKTDRNKDKTN